MLWRLAPLPTDLIHPKPSNYQLEVLAVYRVQTYSRPGDIVAFRAVYNILTAPSHNRAKHQ